MEIRRLGRSDLELSVVGFGAWVTGMDTASDELDEGELDRAILAAYESGITWFDTAEIYSNGRSERILGRVLRPIRDRALIATKVAPAGAGSGFRRTDVHRAVRRSLRRLKTDRLDLYQLHWPDPSVPIQESWGAMRELVDEGLVRAAGLSNVDRRLIERCLEVGPVDAVQNQLSILHPHDAGSLLPWLSDMGIGYLAYGSLAFGLLSGSIDAGSNFAWDDWRSGGPARYERNYYEDLFAPGRIQKHLTVVETLKSMADEIDVTLPVLSIRWALEQPGTTAAVVGSRRPAHIQSNALAGSVRLTAQIRERINGLLADSEI
jgi:aryl-alcohol dehydrogenase-like predicted oxidoreductase